MADQQPWWKAALSAFLEFLRALIASNRAAKTSIETQERMADADAKGARTADDVDERLRTGRF